VGEKLPALGIVCSGSYMLDITVSYNEIKTKMAAVENE